MKLKFFLLLVLTFLIFNFSLLTATVRYVSKTGTSTPHYTSWLTAADSIQKCINICVDGDTVYVANGVYKENLVINTAISLIGSSMDSTIIDGRGLGDYTITLTASGSIENFNIYGKGESSFGRVIFSNTLYTAIEVTKCQISESGVGIETIGGDILKANKLFMINLTRGINLDQDVENNISNCVIILDNENSFGLAMTSPFATATITNNIILFMINNPPPYSANGIYFGLARKVYIYNNLISGFSENIDLGSIADTVYIKYNALMYQNLPGASGSISTSGNTVFVNNVVLSKNRRGVYGFVRSDYNLFWKNTIEDLYGSIYGESDRVADPMFIKDTIPNPQLDFDYHLQAYSSGIDKGDPNILDIDGTRSDIGMYGGPFGETYTYQDLAPLAPRNFSALIDTIQILLKWNHNTEADTAFYNVYQDTVASFQIDTTKLISSPSDTFCIHSIPAKAGKYYYKITCVDNQGNESNPSQELVVNITSVSTDDYPMTINDYVLYQNYPNPFNPSTKIGYQIKERANVRLMVYDLKGELVSVLVNKEQNAGYYEVDFNVNGQSTIGGSNVKGNLASGIYLYRIEVIGEGKIPIFSDMRKMILIK